MFRLGIGLLAATDLRAALAGISTVLRQTTRSGMTAVEVITNELAASIPPELAAISVSAVNRTCIEGCVTVASAHWIASESAIAWYFRYKPIAELAEQLDGSIDRHKRRAAAWFRR